jgi:RimJ/RimL family protein N-acetyltransferase
MTGMRDPDIGVWLSDGVVVLNSYTLADVEAHLAGEDEEQARRFGWYPERSTEDDVRAAIENWREQWRTGGSTRGFAARSAETGELVGGCEIRLQGDGTARISYWTFPPFRRRGLATKAVRLVCDYAFTQLGVERIELHVEPDHAASRGVAERAGFTEEGVMRSGRSFGQERQDMILYSLSSSPLIEAPSMAPGTWRPLPAGEVTSLFAGTGFLWWIAGGWAIDLYVGHQTREHLDIDVGVLRRDQLAVQRTLSGWDLWAADPPGQVRPWQPGEELPLHVHDIWCRRDPQGSWEMQLMLNESSGDRWVYRRDPSVTMTHEQLVFHTGQGFPLLAPEVQLLFKAKNRQPKDDSDLSTVIPFLGQTRIVWLLRQLRRLHPRHPWIPQLAGAGFLTQPAFEVEEVAGGAQDVPPGVWLP